MAALATMVLGIGLLAPPPAAAAASSYVVQGHPISAAPGMRLVGDVCSGTGSPPTVTELARQGGTVGAGALGWSVDQASSEAGPAVRIAGDPATISAARVDVFAPTGTSGHAYAWFPVSDTSYYVGWRYFTVPGGQWIENDLTNVGYYWSYYANGQFVSETEDAWTIQQWAAGEGATVAEVGVLLGCGGEQFYVDDMYVANAANTVSYDFEPASAPPPPPPPPPHTVAHLEWSTNGRDVGTTDRLSIRYGQSIWLLGHSHVHTAAGNEWYSGIGTVRYQPTRGAAGSLGLKGFDPDFYAAYRVRPTQETVYRFTADATGSFPSATSNQVTVLVSSKVRASIVDRKLVQGQRLAVNGRVWPAKGGVKVTLQRKVGKKWKKIESTKTRKRGRFAVATRADRAGTWVVRVLVAPTNTNLGTTTKAAKVNVKRFVPPKKNQPPPPPPVDSTPEQSAPVTTPTPTQVSTTAPTPPDRPTNTGRAPSHGATTSAVPGARAWLEGKDRRKAP